MSSTHHIVGSAFKIVQGDFLRLAKCVPLIARVGCELRTKDKEFQDMCEVGTKDKEFQDMCELGTKDKEFQDTCEMGTKDKEF